jgi:hypothetical protein
MAVSGPNMLVVPVVGEYTIANNQVSPAQIAGLLFDHTKVRSFSLTYTIYRQTSGVGASEVSESGMILGVYSSVAGTWEITPFAVGSSGVDLTIYNPTGQMNYTSSDLSGTPSVSKMTYIYTTMGD